MFLYALTILVSAFLLFQVQPVIAKIILPWFGGSAAVWTTCMLFFQTVLVLGYLYSHAVIRYLKPRMQTLVHCGMLVLSAAVLPILPSSTWKPLPSDEPTFRILGLLAVTVGLPYFMLATTGPLIQAWYARRFHGSMPYRLYALSNVGSMGALLSYPFLFEPAFGTHQQASIWSWGYGAFLALCAFTAFVSGSDSEDAEPAAERREYSAAPGGRTYALWLLLPATASVLLLAITNHVSANVATIPFLWILPLSIYLLTFILCFEGEGWYRRNPYLQLLVVGLGSMAYAMGIDSTGNVPIRVLVPLLSIGLFTCCMVCHGELVKLKPDARYLTHFYLMISVGGAMGGLLVGLIAPHFFNSFYELPIGLAMCGITVLIALRAHPDWEWLKGLLSAARLLIAAVVLAVLGFNWPTLWNAVARGWSPEDNVRTSIMMGAFLLAGVIVSSVVRGGLGWVRRDRAAVMSELLILMLIGYLASEVRATSNGYRVVVRNFYGGMRVRDNGVPTSLDATRTLTHGTINHGEEYLNPARRHLATTYYGPNTGVGLAVREKQSTGPVRIGVIGLGTGTVASYGRPGDYIRYYEINPLVLNIARTEFYFLPDCKAKLDVAMGDARLSLERETPENFDVLAVDAFSSDSIPVHLLTREAMELYFHHLKPDGILAVHISNRYLDLQPVLQGETAVLHKVARVVDTEDDETQDVFGATWVLITNPATGFTPDELSNSAPLESKRTVRLWTDDYSNLFKILK
jgi:hypothetical protein